MILLLGYRFMVALLRAAARADADKNIDVDDPYTL